MSRTETLKAIANETRMEILKLLLRQNYCVRALANELHLTEGTISQHLKVLREAGLLVGEKRGYYMHYQVDRQALCELAAKIGALAEIENEACKPDMQDDCPATIKGTCHKQGECSEETKEFCHGGEKRCRHGEKDGE